MKKLKDFKCFLNEGFDDTSLGIKEDKKDLTVKFLNRLLSNEFILFMKIWNFHWIIVSPTFGPTHNFFGDLYEEFFKIIDNTSERIRTLGGRPFGTLSEYLNTTELKEYDQDNDVPEESDMYQRLLEDFEFVIREIRNFLGTNGIDNGTINYLEDLLMNIEKDAWKIRSHIK
jgi:starvation-inducible DNA-binding protein